MQDSLDAMNLSIVQTPLEHYPFAVSQSSTKLTTRKPGDKTTTFAIGTILYIYIYICMSIRVNSICQSCE